MFYVVSACAPMQSKFPMAAFVVRSHFPTSAPLMRRDFAFFVTNHIPILSITSSTPRISTRQPDIGDGTRPKPLQK